MLMLADCDTCKRLFGHNFVDLRSKSIPEHLAGLIGNSPTDLASGSIIECPVCGTFYRYTYTCGFGENDIELHRIAPNEIGRPTDIDKFTRGLNHVSPEVRRYSALCLVDYYLSQENDDAVEELLNHPDSTVRSASEAAATYCEIREELNSSP